MDQCLEVLGVEAVFSVEESYFVIGIAVAAVAAVVEVAAVAVVVVASAFLCFEYVFPFWAGSGNGNVLAIAVLTFLFIFGFCTLFVVVLFCTNTTILNIACAFECCVQKRKTLVALLHFINFFFGYEFLFNEGAPETHSID